MIHNTVEPNSNSQGNKKVGGEGGGWETREQWGQKVYGRREKRGWETGYPRGWKLGEIGNKFHIAQLNCSQ